MTDQISATIPCSLCGEAAGNLGRDRRRRYYRCPDCELVFADPDSHLDPVAEKARYDLHRNHPAEMGYRRFLTRLSAPLLARLRPGQWGLDYGCGPGPVLAMILRQAGMTVAVYDPYYAPDPRPLRGNYDFVTCSETAEHFKSPGREWKLMADLLLPGGWLGIMTGLLKRPEDFFKWHYKNDPTHISFYSPATIAWLGRRLGLEIAMISGDVILLRKGSPG